MVQLNSCVISEEFYSGLFWLYLCCASQKQYLYVKGEGRGVERGERSRDKASVERHEEMKAIIVGIAGSQTLLDPR